MKANELMIDDWVYNKNIDKPMQVYPMMFSQMFRQKPDAKTEDYNIFPIPLTPEILEKNGWRNSAPDVWGKEYGGFVFHWENRTGRFGMYDFRHLQEQWTMHFQIKYTHQLQHALRLFGIKREIEL